MCLAHCPRSLNLDVFAGSKVMGQGTGEVKDRIFPFNTRVLVSYSVLGTLDRSDVGRNSHGSCPRGHGYRMRNKNQTQALKDEEVSPAVNTNG